MSDQNLLDALDDCIARINRGQSVEECLRVYPELAVSLRPMLETGLYLRTLRAKNGVLPAAKDRVRQRLIAYQRRARITNTIWTATRAAVFALVLSIAVLGINFANQIQSGTPVSDQSPTPTLTATATPTATLTTTPSPSPTSTIRTPSTRPPIKATATNLPPTVQRPTLPPSTSMPPTYVPPTLIPPTPGEDRHTEVPEHTAIPGTHQPGE